MIVEVKDLRYKYNNDSKEVLKGISFSIDKGEWVSIIGHNGSGKSTIAKLLLGIINKTSGSIYINGIEVTEDNLYEVRKHIGIVYQNPDNQFVATSIEDDIAFGLENLCVDPKDMEMIIDDSLKKVSMTKYKYESPSNLSGGEKQRCAIASILAINPDVYVFDESTSMLDPKGRVDVMNVLRYLKSIGKTIIMITHDMNEVMLSDRTICIKDGIILKDDKTINVLNDYKCLKETNLEMPSDLYLIKLLKDQGYKNEEALSKLWEYALKK